jgi:hypothetical protein
MKEITSSDASLTDYKIVGLGGLVVIVLATGPKVQGFKPVEDDGFLRPHMVGFNGMLKCPAEYERDTSTTKFTAISRQVSPSFATRCLCCFMSEKSGVCVVNDYSSDEECIIFQ